MAQRVLTQLLKAAVCASPALVPLAGSDPLVPSARSDPLVPTEFHFLFPLSFDLRLSFKFRFKIVLFFDSETFFSVRFERVLYISIVNFPSSFDVIVPLTFDA